jgi:hypothetical protein
LIGTFDFDPTMRPTIKGWDVAKVGRLSVNDGQLRHDFDRSLKLGIHRSGIATDAGLLAYRKGPNR